MRREKPFKRAALSILLSVLSLTVLFSCPGTAYAADGQDIAGAVTETVRSIIGAVFRTFPEKGWYDGAGEDELPESREESAGMLIREAESIISTAYERNIQEVRNEAEMQGLDPEMTLNTYYRQGDVLNNVDYAYLLSVYSLKDPHLVKTLEGFRKDLAEAVPEMCRITVTPADTESAPEGEQVRKVPVYKYVPADVELCRDRKERIQTGTETVTVPTAGGGTRDVTRKVYETVTVHDSYTVSGRFYVREKDSDGEDIVDFWITDEEGRLVTDYVEADISYIADEDHVEDDEHLYEDDGEQYYEIGPGDGEEPGMVRVFPEFYTVDYGIVTVEPFSNSDVWDIFGIDRDAPFFETVQEKSTDWYGSPGAAVHYDDAATNEEIANIRYSLFRDFYGEAVAMQGVRYSAGLSAEEIKAYLAMLPEDTSGNRRQVIKTALSLVNQVSYCNNGEDSKPKMAGYDPSWYDYSRCDALGRPSGLDSSGFVQWAFWTAGFSEEETKELGSTASISNRLDEIVDREDIKPGDIGLVQLGVTDENSEAYNRVGIYLGKDTDGTELWIVNSPVENTVTVSRTESFGSVKVFSPRMEDGDLYSEDIVFYGAGSTEAGGNIYTVAQIIMQECGDGGTGTAAVAECVKNRAVDVTEFGSVGDAWSVLTQKGQFEAYSSGAYRKQVPNGAVIDLIQQVLAGRYAVLNNPHVLYFVSEAYHNRNYGKPDNFRSKMAVFGNYGGNVYYVAKEYLGYTGTSAALMTGSVNASANTAVARSYMGNVSALRQEIVLYASSCAGQIPYYLGWRSVFGSEVYPGDLTRCRFGTTVRADPYKKSRSSKGLDCSGFVDFVLASCGIDGFFSYSGSLGTGDIQRSGRTEQISASELKPGDLGFKFTGDSDPDSGNYNHTGIYAGNGMWIHCSSYPDNKGAQISAYSSFTVFYRVKGVD